MYRNLTNIVLLCGEVQQMDTQVEGLEVEEKKFKYKRRREETVL